MLDKWLTGETVNIIDSVDNWKQAVRLSGVPLLEQGIISPDYIQAIYHLHEDIGPYYVLAPGIAMPHARPEQGANKLGLSMLLIKNGVSFNSEDNDPVYLVVMLAAPDSDSHLQLIGQLAELFSSDEDMNILFAAQKTQQLLDVIARY